MRKIVTVELRSDGDHLYARPLFHSGWRHLTGTSAPRSGWSTLPLDPAAAVLRRELEILLEGAVHEIGACWEFEAHEGRWRLGSAQEDAYPDDQRDDDQDRDAHGHL